MVEPGERRITEIVTERIQWPFLANAVLGQFLAGLAARSFTISLPTVASSLGTDILGISWALISFQLASVSLSLVFGRLGDLYGRSKLCALGFVVLATSSFLCGMAQDVVQLIAFRFLQGIGGAMVQSSARAMAMDAVPPGWEGKAQGFMTVAFHTGFFIGPPLGGFLIESIGWRAVFFVMVPIGVTGIILSVLSAKRGLGKNLGKHHSSVDYIGAAMLILLSVVLILLIDHKSAELAGIKQPALLGVIFAGVLLSFLAYERRLESPILNTSLFKIRMFSYSIVSLFTLSITRGLVAFLLPFYLQDILGLAPSFMGLLFLVQPIFTLSLAPVSGHMTDRIGPRVPATLGVLSSLASVLVGFFFRPDSHWWIPAVMLAFSGAGTALFNSANQAAVIGSVPPDYRGFATGMVHTGFELGHMLGVSVGGVLLTVAYHYYSGIPDATPGPDDPEAFVSSMNVSYLSAAACCIVALGTSLLRGSGKIRAAKKDR
jgi:EmrB/QacA subfamily drug resistance transporter